MPVSYNSRGSECTATLKDGRFCSAAAMEGLPFPLCTRHAIQIYRALLGIVRDTLGPTEAQINAAARFATIRNAERKGEEISQVYYIDMPGDMIKIGFTINIVQRCSQLRVDRDRVLAAEPGGRMLERIRHRDFASLRLGMRENFKPDPELMRFIERTREKYGPPIMTGL